MNRRTGIGWILAVVFLLASSVAAEQVLGKEQMKLCAAGGEKEITLVIGTDEESLRQADLLAWQYRKRGQYDAAIAQYRKIIEAYQARNDLSPEVLNSWRIHYLRKIAACYREKKSIGLAITQMCIHRGSNNRLLWLSSLY